MPDPVDEWNARMNAEAHAAWHRANPDAGRILSHTLRSTMPHVNQMLQSKYLSKQDVAAPVIAHIRGVALDGSGRQNEDPRWVMYFNEVRKPLRLNNTTLRYLAECLGPNSDGWIGAKVRIYVDQSVMMAGQIVGGVRLEVAKSHMRKPADVSAEFFAGAGGQVPPGSGGPVFAGNATPGRPTAGAGALPHGVDPTTGEDFRQGPPGGQPARPAQDFPVTGAPRDPDFNDDIPF